MESKNINFFFVIGAIMAAVIVFLWLPLLMDESFTTSWSSVSPIQDTGSCEKLQSGEKQDECYKKVAENIRDFNVCSKITNSLRQDSCYYSVASYTLDPTICSKITGTLEKEGCYSNLAIYLQDPSLCDFVTQSPAPYPSSRFRDMCYDAAYHGGLPIMKSAVGYDFSFCKKIEDISYRKGCYRKTMEGIQDFSCDQVTGLEKDLCFVGAAFLKRDITICGLIKNSQEKSSCLSQWGP